MAFIVTNQSKCFWSQEFRMQEPEISTKKIFFLYPLSFIIVREMRANRNELYQIEEYFKNKTETNCKLDPTRTYFYISLVFVFRFFNYCFCYIYSFSIAHTAPA
jgi:hypothetical protein